MTSESKRSLHPLLLERGYWSPRLRELRGTRASLVLIPRPELSTNAVLVEEFRVRAHDGTRLWGLRARSRFGSASARVRAVGPSELPQFDRQAVEQGLEEFIFQEPAGRRLADRVLDVLRVCQVAAEVGGRASQVQLAGDAAGTLTDEFLIASQLLAEEPPAEGPALPPWDGHAGWPARA
jgi:hypothetical protein